MRDLSIKSRLMALVAALLALLILSSTSSVVRLKASNDVLATVYHVLGIDQNVELTDKVGRPVKVLASGEPIREVI